MESKRSQIVVEYPEKKSDLVETICQDMPVMRKSLQITLSEVSGLTGISEEEIRAQEEGKTAPNLEIITPVMLIYYMLAMKDTPQWLVERLDNLRK